MLRWLLQPEAWLAWLVVLRWLLQPEAWLAWLVVLRWLLQPEAWLARLVEHLTCKQKVVGSNPTLGRYFSTQVYLNGDKEIWLQVLEGPVDHRACGCRGVMPRSRQFISTTVYPFKDQGGEECSDSLAFLTRSPVSLNGRASDLQAEGHGFESYTAWVDISLPKVTSVIRGSDRQQTRLFSVFLNKSHQYYQTVPLV